MIGRTLVPWFWNRCHLLSVAVLCFAACGGGPHAVWAESVDAPEVVATLDGDPILLEDVTSTAALRLYRLRLDMYTLLKQETDRLIDERLLAREAQRRGITVDALLEAEVTARVPPLAPDAVEAYLAEHPADAARGPEARPRIEAYLAERARIQRRLDYMEELRGAAAVTVLLEPPERPRVALDLGDAPARGPADAPVTLVHFASFTSPQCAESAHAIQQVVAHFPNQVRWVHVNFFQRRSETDLRAVQAAALAQDADRFWAFHDAVYAGELDPEGRCIAAALEGLGLAFPEVGAATEQDLIRRAKRDIERARSAGVTGAPTIFVNGRYFNPGYGVERLQALVAEELALKAAPGP